MRGFAHDTVKCPGSYRLLRERVASYACDKVEVPTGDAERCRAARKGTRGLLPGAENWSSEVRVSDGMLEPNPEDLSHYCLLLGDGDINDRGEGNEGFNTPVCRLRGVQKTVKRRPLPCQDRACAKTGLFFSFKNPTAPRRAFWFRPCYDSR